MTAMTQRRLRTWQKATALVPLALLSGAWTTSLLGLSGASAAPDQASLPDGTSLPAEAIEDPASLSTPGEIAPGVPSGTARDVVLGASAHGIPDAALAAYQRAAQVIDTADRSCHLSWQLIGAIGRIESDHGRYGGNVLSDEGVATPGIYGIPLDGSNGTARIADTDGGKYDDDEVLDRAVGPMQFIPSTWSVVGVDGDGDGVRDPQDIDDAALGTAVYLCSGDEDLATTTGQRTAVYRYNHSQEYVDLVLAIMRAYTDGDYTAVPTGTGFAATFTSTPGATGPDRPRGNQGPRGSGGGASSGGGAGTPSGGTGGGTGGGGGGTGGGDSGTGGSGGGSGPVGGTTQNVEKVLVSAAQAVALCTAELEEQYGEAPAEAVDACVAELQGKTLPAATAAVGGVVQGLADVVDDLLGGLLGGGGLLD